MTPISKTYPVSFEAIEEALSAIQSLLQELSSSEETTFKVVTCCREALNNIVQHSGQFEFTSKVRLFTRSQGTLMVIAFEHLPTVHQTPADSSMPYDSLSGRGLPIMDAWMDRFRLRQTDQRTQTLLMKYLISDEHH
ncbi:ATP-binding protein [Marinobacter sp. AL4B]|uniref:ATP-binding protein n=1 Tax=Marinobacter sp. AL4B TaxID=2871173 RepID=UPI001CAA78CE|nr:ATP-binding protein [Marinobacter sp. AL4B]MBZ0333437.1 ATP-binding protein [Marinobacter sp. AL4B]